MADYSIWVLGESNISISDGATLDGITNGDGRQLVGKTMTINTPAAEEMFISDAGSETNFADNDRGQRLDGDQTIDGVTYSGGTRVEAEYQFVLRDDSTGNEYKVLAVNVVNSRVAYGTNEALAFVGEAPPAGTPLRVTCASEGPRNGGSRAIDESEIVPICFCAGTLIHTDLGARPVETLQAGDRVKRRDGSNAVLRAVVHMSFEAEALAHTPKLRPIRIAAGALGVGCPARDLRVSRQHRMLVSSKIAARMFGSAEVLVPAVKLLPLPGVSVDTEATCVDYYHLLFDQHEVIWAEGAATESLFLGRESLKTLGAVASAELAEHVADAALSERLDGLAAPPARALVDGKSLKNLVARHIRHHKPLVSPQP